MKDFIQKNPQKYLLASALGLLFFNLYESLILGSQVLPDYFFTKFLVFFPSGEILPLFSTLLPFFFFINAICGWWLIYRVFRSHIVGFLASCLSIMHPMFFSLGTVDHQLFFITGFFWPLSCAIFAFFSSRPSFFPAFFVGVLLAFIFYIFPLSYGIILIFTVLLMSFSLATLTYHGYQKYRYFFLSSALSLLVFIVFWKISGFHFNLNTAAFSEPLRLDSYFSFTPFYTHHFGAFFPGILLTLVCLLGGIFYWYRFVLFGFFFLFCLFFSFGAWEFFWKSLGASSQIFLLPVMMGLIFFTLLFVWFSKLRNRFFYQVLELIFVFILLVESYHLSLQHNFFQQLIFSVEKNNQTASTPELISETRDFLEGFSYRSILDERVILSDFLWHKEGIKKVDKDFLGNENLLSLHGTGVIFSEKISVPNPLFWEKINLAHKAAWHYKSALPKFYIRSFENLETSEKLAYRIENIRLDFANKVYSKKEWDWSAMISSEVASSVNRLQVLSEEWDAITMKVWLREPSFLIFSDLDADIKENIWQARVNGTFYPLGEINLLHQGLLLDSGVYEVSLFREEPAPYFSREMFILLGTFMAMFMIEFYLRRRRRNQLLAVKSPPQGASHPLRDI